jgi:hypothetical protein
VSRKPGDQPSNASPTTGRGVSVVRDPVAVASNKNHCCPWGSGLGVLTLASEPLPTTGASAASLLTHGRLLGLASGRARPDRLACAWLA